jgi:dihydrofolate synthase/folylpolyglutamate synthase
MKFGLETMRALVAEMGHPERAWPSLLVAGTNGKGSVAAYCDAALRASGLRTGRYTSPHLVRVNERITVNGREIGDADFARAVRAVRDAASRLVKRRVLRAHPTFFEVLTAAAFEHFRSARVDVAVLEVGLGGRLDAVNIVDADAVVITTIDMDHMDWLGNDRDSIGREKAGIARRGRPAIIGETDPPAGLLDALAACGAHVQRAGHDFYVERHARGWRWQHRDGTAFELPDPSLAAPVQYANAAAAIAALHALDAEGGLAAPMALGQAAADGLSAVRVPARLQPLGGDPALVVDVGHNPQAARALADWLDLRHFPRVLAVFGALADKDVAGVLAALGPRIDRWHLAGLDQASPRGMPVGALTAALRQTLPQAPFDAHADVPGALAAARAQARPGECILAFGSFFVASAVLAEPAC